MRVLVTRPAEDCERTIDALRAAGHGATAAPLFTIEPLAHAPPQGVCAIVATSANALRHARLGADALALPLHAVGAATAAEAARRGFSDIRSADGDSADLAARIASGPGGRVAWLAGRPRRSPALNGLGPRFALEVVETYATTPIARLPDAAADALRAGRIDAVLHFSPRAAEVFDALSREAGAAAQAARALHVFISRAAELTAWPDRKIAARPNLAAMIEALSRPAPEGRDGG